MPMMLACPPVPARVGKNARLPGCAGKDLAEMCAPLMPMMLACPPAAELMPMMLACLSVPEGPPLMPMC